jgi:hypothetical protein
MTALSYNEQHTRLWAVRHVFFPSSYGLVAEIIVGGMALVLFNLSTLSNELFSRDLGSKGGDPLEGWDALFTKVLNSGQSHDVVQKILLFLLWAVAGALLYVLVFRLAQLFFGAKTSLSTGMQLVRQEHAVGLLHWLATLHDFFLKLTIIVLGSAAVIAGVLLCFGIASQELQIGLARSFPSNLWPLVLSLFAAALSVRCVALGISLLSARFRSWYTA